MPRRCQLTGTHSHSGQNVSHSNRKSKRRFEPNLQHAHLHSEALGRRVRIRVTTRALRTVQKRGGLDAYLIATDDAKLPPEALSLKRLVLKALH
jgi:large subunit ribosomal protein L28